MTDDRHRKILQAALEVFMRYGYRRATMDDVAQAVGVSRPALYLSFPSKEAIFRGVVEMGLDDMIGRIETGLPAQRSLEEKLRHVFEIWTVQPFDAVARSPAADELTASSYDFAKDVFEQGAQRLAAILAAVLRAAVVHPGTLQPPAEERARIMIAAAHGFKSAARDTADMRMLIHDLVRIVVAGLDAAVEAGGKARRTPSRKPARRKAGA